jgi:hypothetical protein
MTDHTAPASAPIGPQTWYFTFGLDSPLSRRFVALYSTEAGARSVFAAVFGNRWAAQYHATRWEEIQAKASARGKPYIQLVLGIPGERIMPDQAPTAESYSLDMLDAADLSHLFGEVRDNGRSFILTQDGRAIGVLGPVRS